MDRTERFERLLAAVVVIGMLVLLAVAICTWPRRAAAPVAYLEEYGWNVNGWWGMVHLPAGFKPGETLILITDSAKTEGKDE